MAEEKYLAEYEKSAAGNYLKRSRGILRNTISVAAAKTLIEEESGSTIIVDASAAYTITLPAKKAGLEFDFRLAVADTNIVKVLGTVGNSDVIGASMDLSGAINAISNKGFQFASSAVVGSRVTLVCDGTTWHASGVDCGTDKIAGTNS
tara:strand:+ start:111 stop:557 length:447 start_codon:yes stop_codon:yes gene_type:complete